MKKYRIYLEIEADDDSTEHDIEDWINDIWWDDAEVTHYTISTTLSALKELSPST